MLTLRVTASLAEAIQVSVRPQVNAVVDDRGSRERLLAELGRVQRAAFAVGAEHRQPSFLVDQIDFAVTGNR